MKALIKRTARQGIVVASAVLLLAGVGYTFAAPTYAPTTANTAYLPLTRSSTAETKAGALTVQGALTASGGLAVSGGSGLCINGTCKTAWPTSTVQAATNTVTGTQNISCYAQNYGNISYYYINYYGGSWTNSSMYVYYCDAPFTVTTTASAGVPITVVANNTVCLLTGTSGASYTYTYPASCYAGYYCSATSYTLPTNMTVSFNSSNQVTVSGTCRLYSSYSYYYAYGVAYTSADVRYLY